MKPTLSKKQLLRLFQAPPGKVVRLKEYHPGWLGTAELRSLHKDALKESSQQLLKQNVQELSEAQQLLWASDRQSVLIVLQGMDASGKDGTIRHVMSGLNPQGCTVHSFKKPSEEEAEHTFLWRHIKATPERGQIAVFNRSHYEDVIVTRVHPELLDLAKVPPDKRGKELWKKRYQDINAFEHHLSRSGTVILKFFLHVSKGEQKKRLLERLENPKKHWKFSIADLAERERWADYMDAYEKAISATSTKWAPWWIIPADHKFVTRVLVARIITNAVESLDLRYPELTPEQKKLLAQARRRLTKSSS